MQGKERKHTSAAAQTAQQQQQQQQHSRHWQNLLQHRKAPVQSAAAAHSNPPTHATTGADHGSGERPAWLSFLQGMLDAHQKHHLDGISISRDNSSIKHSKSSSSSSKHIHRKGHHGLAGPAAAAAAAAAMTATDNSSTTDNDVSSAPTPHAAWPVCWPYV
jgi:hypothetical protein